MNLSPTDEEAVARTISQFVAGAFHDSDFAGFRVFPPTSVRLILDVGANRGQSIASLRLAFPAAAVHAFEANPAYFSVLAEVARRVPGPVELHSYGLGRENTTIPLYVPWVFSEAYLEESSTRLDYFEKPWVVEKFRARGPMHLEETAVELRCGDDLKLLPDIVKIDVEGAEFDVITGLRNTIELTKPSLLVENSDWDHVTPWLGEFGYEPYRWEPSDRHFVPFYGTTANTFYFHPCRLKGLPLRRR